MYFLWKQLIVKNVFSKITGYTLQGLEKLSTYKPILFGVLEFLLISTLINDFVNSHKGFDDMFPLL